ncbi:MAG: hypothetical protein DI547_04950 [Sphingobium sp.]|nr:MAG: hypothetical protein DI547_04950 [Sphingobium sp.]
MPIPDLESRTQALFSVADDWLGDSIVITPPSGDPITVKAHVSHRDTRLDFGASAATVQDALLDIDMALVPGKPDATWRIALPRIAGKTFQPRGVERDISGFRWEFGIKEVVGA